MSKKKKTTGRRTAYLPALLMGLIWTAMVIIFVIAVFSYGLNVASGVIAASYAAPGAALSGDPGVQIAAVSRARNDLEAIREKVEAYVRQNIVSLAEENKAGDDGLAVDSVDFINDNRALVFYNGRENTDRYLAEIVFQPTAGPVKIDRFILKVENDTDYSGGLYGAD